MQGNKKYQARFGSVLIFDINKFKQLNDTYGHTEGDRALELVAQQIYKVYGKYGACYRKHCFIHLSLTDMFQALGKIKRRLD